jgi:hypothetical protein
MKYALSGLVLAATPPFLYAGFQMRASSRSFEAFFITNGQKKSAGRISEDAVLNYRPRRINCNHPIFFSKSINCNFSENPFISLF